MRPTVFLDSNVLLSGTFFHGNESKLLASLHVKLITCDVVIAEVLTVARRKFLSFRLSHPEIALRELVHSFRNLDRILMESDYRSHLSPAKTLVRGLADAKILAAVLAAKPDYFVTGDRHFHTPVVRSRVPIRSTTELLRALRLK